MLTKFDRELLELIICQSEFLINDYEERKDTYIYMKLHANVVSKM